MSRGCGDCKKQFTGKVGSVFEHVRIPLNVMLQALFLMTASKKGVSAHQLHRTLEITYKSAWFLADLIREAVRFGDLPRSALAAGLSKWTKLSLATIARSSPRAGAFITSKVLALVDRSTGRSRCMAVDSVRAADIVPILMDNIAAEAIVMTGEAGQYRWLGGIYQRRGKKHLHRYVADFEFRYSSREATGFNDRNRSEQAMRGIVGKCLTYRTVGISA